MSKLEELIAELCPDGVEYKTLGEIAHYSADRIDSKEVDSQTYIGVDNLLPEKQGKKTSAYVPTEGRLNQFLKGDILIGNIRPYLKKIWLATHDGGTNGDVLVIQVNDPYSTSPEYMFYALSSDRFFLYDMQNSKGAKMPRGDKSAVMKYKVSLPPLPVQREIVRILDNFTELAAELAARKNQYNYYLNQLLTFEHESVRWMPLGDVIISLNTGLNPRQFFRLNTHDARNYYVTIRELQLNKIVVSEKTDRINDEALRLCNNRSNLEIGDILFSGTGTIGETAIIEEPPSNWNIKEGVYTIKPKQTVILPRFLMYVLKSQQLRTQYMQKAAGGTVKSVPMGEMRKLKIPIPPLEEQARIVAILDRFDALCNDISSGLPAEIEARRKQYEYYRDRLLTFREKTP